MNVNRSPDEELLVKITWLYYFGGLTQQAIAQKLNLSRPKVGRMIKKALDIGIVEIRLSPSVQSYHFDIENKLETRFGLREALVVDSGSDQASLFDNLGIAGARYLDRTLEDDFLLGIGLGTSISAMLPHVKPRNSSSGTIITLSGGFSQPGHDTSAYNASWPLADLLSARLEQLYCPLVAENEEARNAIFNDRHLKAQFERAMTCDVAIISIGKVNLDMPLYTLDFCEEEDVEQLQNAGAVGEIIISFYDLDGNIIKTDLTNRNIGLGIEELLKIPTTVAISGGLEKRWAILGALRNGCLDVLITDQLTAQAVLNLDDETRKS